MSRTLNAENSGSNLRIERDLLRYLYDWVAGLPVKHPQQAEMRERVRCLLEDK